MFVVVWIKFSLILFLDTVGSKMPLNRLATAVVLLVLASGCVAEAVEGLKIEYYQPRHVHIAFGGKKKQFSPIYLSINQYL